MPDLKCFLIDDDPDDREIFALALEEVDKDFQCITASNGMEALKKLNSEDGFVPDFIFLDLNMPIMSGKQCLHEIKKISRLSQVPVIIYSTSSYALDIEETKQLGASHFLIKPSSIRILTSSLADVIRQDISPYLIQSTIAGLSFFLLINPGFYQSIFQIFI